MLQMLMTRLSIGPALLLFALMAVWLPTTASAQTIQVIPSARQQELVANTAKETAGTQNSDVTIVEYFDYNCPFCRELAPDLHSLIAQDHKVAVVYKDWPIFGGVSVYAARAALAATWQGKYSIAHDTLINGPRLTQEDQVTAELKGAGIDTSRLTNDLTNHAAEIDALLKRNDAEAHALGIRGTPGIVVGRQVLPGTVNLAGLKLLVASARRE
jgi:protein-disulfide isomerase